MGIDVDEPSIVEALHDMPFPVQVLVAVRAMVKPHGVVVVVVMNEAVAGRPQNAPNREAAASTASRSSPERVRSGATCTRAEEAAGLCFQVPAISPSMRRGR